MSTTDDPCIHCGIAQDKVPVGACQGDFTKAKPVAFRSLGVRHDGVEHFLIRYSDWSVREHHAHVSYHSPYYHFGHSREMDNTLRYDPRLNT